MPVRMFIAAGPVADCSQASRLIEGINAEYLLADKGYDNDALVEFLQQAGASPVIPPLEVVKAYGLMINTFIDFGTLLKMPSWN